MTKKPSLKFWQIWNMSFGFLGIQFGFALQNANVSRIFETLGANIEDIPILWIAAPVTGLIIQPIIGHMSDKTWGKLGRRRPYFLVGAILASLALIIMPNSPFLWAAAGTLWIMDASINISMEPFRAFVGDMLPSEQRTTGFAMQSFFIGTGAVIASALPYILTNWIGVENTATEGSIPPSVKWSFYLGAAVFISAITWTILNTKEYSPEQLKEFGNYDNQIQKTELVPGSKRISFYRIGFFSTSIGLLFTLFLVFMKLEKELFILSGGLFLFGMLEILAGKMHQSGSESGFVEVISDLNNMPKTMIQLAVVQFFSWFALFAMWIYTTAAVTSHIYDMKVDRNFVAELKPSFTQIVEKSAKKDNLVAADFENLSKKVDKQGISVMNLKLVQFFNANQDYLQPNQVEKIKYIEKQYNDGADWVGVCFSIYNGAAAIFAFFLMFLARKTSRKVAHSISLVIGGISFISIFFIHNPDILLIPFLGIGLAWASILAMPYAILTGSLPVEKMGTYMGIFNFFIVIPQILAASLLGFFVRFLFDGQAIYALVLGGVSFLLAAGLVVIVRDKD